MAAGSNSEFRSDMSILYLLLLQVVSPRYAIPFLKLFDTAWLLGIVLTVLYDEDYSVFGRTLQICTELRRAVG
jgi:hypothetical protein